MIARVVYRDEIPTMTPIQMVMCGLSDPKVVSPKKEGHNKKKRDAGKWRSIWVCSIVDLVCEALCQYPLNKKQIQDFQAGEHFKSAALGVGHDEHGVKLLTAAIERIRNENEGGKIGSADASGWDFSVTRDELLIAGDIRAAVTTADTSLHADAIGLALRLQAFITSAHCFMLGRIVYQVFLFAIVDSIRHYMCFAEFQVFTL